MDLAKYTFPEVRGVDMAFPTFQTDKTLLKEAIDRGFYDGSTPYNKLFNHLLFRGGRVIFKPDVNEEFKTRAWAYCRAFMGSFAPKHEEKEAICAMLMSELLEPSLAKTK